jgi:hypothetical protein
VKVMIGVDPHKGSHTAVAINGDEVELAKLKVRATRRQVDQLLDWAAAFEKRTWAIESASVRTGGSCRHPTPIDSPAVFPMKDAPCPYSLYSEGYVGARAPSVSRNAALARSGQPCSRGEDRMRLPVDAVVRIGLRKRR